MSTSTATRQTTGTEFKPEEQNSTMQINNSAMAIEGIISPDGRVIGKMGHSERVGSGLYKNVIGNYDIKLFESAVKYFK